MGAGPLSCGRVTVSRVLCASRATLSPLAARSVSGRIMADSPAERCGQLNVGDCLVAVNNVDVTKMHHDYIVNLIKESGQSVTLTVVPLQGQRASRRLMSCYDALVSLCVCV